MSNSVLKINSLTDFVQLVLGCEVFLEWLWMGWLSQYRLISDLLVIGASRCMVAFAF